MSCFNSQNLFKFNSVSLFKKQKRVEELRGDTHPVVSTKLLDDDDEYILTEQFCSSIDCSLAIILVLFALLNRDHVTLCHVQRWRITGVVCSVLE